MKYAGINLEEFVKKAMKGSALLLDERASYSQLARVLGVSRSQPGKWMKGTIPSKHLMEAMKILADYYDSISESKRLIQKKLGNIGYIVQI